MLYRKVEHAHSSKYLLFVFNIKIIYRIISKKWGVNNKKIIVFEFFFFGWTISFLLCNAYKIFLFHIHISVLQLINSGMTYSLISWQENECDFSLLIVIYVLQACSLWSPLVHCPILSWLWAPMALVWETTGAPICWTLMRCPHGMASWPRPRRI